MKKIYLIPIAAVMILAAVSLFFIPESKARENNSQDFTPSRFIIVASPINVISPQMGDRNQTYNVMVKMDTVTGRTWILQLDVSGGNEARVRRSTWLETGMPLRMN